MKNYIIKNYLLLSIILFLTAALVSRCANDKKTKKILQNIPQFRTKKKR